MVYHPSEQKLYRYHQHHLKVVSPLLIPVKNIIINVSRFEYGCEMKEILLPNGDFFFPPHAKADIKR